MAKAPAKKNEMKTDPDGEEPAPKKRSKLSLIAGLSILFAAGGGAAWFFMSKGSHAETPQLQAKPKPPVFVPLDPFTVNLSPEQGEQYLQVSATLKVLDQPAAEAVKQFMPEVRHKVLVLLSTKKALEIASGEGRERLAEEIRQTANNITLAAAGRPVKPILLDAPRNGTTANGEATAADAVASGAAEGAAPADSAKPAEAADPAAPAGPRPTAMLSKAAADDPVQSVFFTSFIIQ